MTPEEMWQAFRGPDAAPDYEAWAFGGPADELAELVRRGIKTATASAGPVYEAENSPLPAEGAYSVILDSRGAAVCIIRTTRVEVVPFRLVSARHAWEEGEGDRSLDFWRQIHAPYFTRELAAVGLAFTEDMPVVCERFQLVYPLTAETP